MAKFITLDDLSKFKTKLDAKYASSSKDVDSTPTDNSKNLITSGGVKTYVDEQVSNLDSKYMPIKGVDDTPTDNSENLITSGGVKSYIDAQGSGFDLSMLPKYESRIDIDLSKQTDLAGLLTLDVVESSNFAVDWGDGSSAELFSEATTQIVHQYADPNFKGIIRVYGEWSGFKFGQNNSNNSKKTIIKIYYSRYITELPEYALNGVYYLNQFDSENNSIKKFHKYSLNTMGGSWGGVKVKPELLKRSAWDSNSLTQVSVDSNVIVFDEPEQNNFYNAQYIFSKLDVNKMVFIYQRVIPTRFTDSNQLHEIELIPWDGTSYKYQFKNNAFDTARKLRRVYIRKGGYNLAELGTNVFSTNLKEIIVDESNLRAYKTATNWTLYADKIYPEGGSYSETVTLPVVNWADGSQTVEVVGSTSEARNVIEFILVDSNGNQVEDIYGLTATQGTMQMTFTCQTVPTEDVYVFIKSTLTNY